jgi:HAD superfamily hydrolase (TIGR01490 family)
VAPVRAAAFFDLDKTLISRSSALAFARPFHAGGLVSRPALLRAAYAQLVLSVNGLDHDAMERMRDYFSRLVTGWDVAQVRRIVEERVEELIDPLVYAEATELIAGHRAAGDDVVIVSTSGIEVVEPIAARLGADHVVATRAEVVDGRLTGRITDYVYGPGKAAAVHRLAVEHGYDLARCHAYSDSVTDLPMLEAVGHPHAVNPDRGLRREALARGWPVLDFAAPPRRRGARAGRRRPGGRKGRTVLPKPGGQE